MYPIIISDLSLVKFDQEDLETFIHSFQNAKFIENLRLQQSTSFFDKGYNNKNMPKLSNTESLRLLSFNFTEEHAGLIEIFPKLKKLYLKVSKEKDHGPDELPILSELKGLKELTID